VLHYPARRIAIFQHNEFRLRDEQIRWIEKEVQPDIYVVCSVKQFFPSHNERGLGFTQGDRELYERLCDHFHARLSKAIVGRKRWRKSKTRIPMAATLENKGASGLYHLNFHVRCPHWMTFEDFRDVFRDTWWSMDWHDPQIYFEDRRGESSAYSMTEGSGTLLVW
jgi:hypothetical protein